MTTRHLGIRAATIDDLDFVLDVQKRAMSPAVIAEYGAWSDALQRKNTNADTIATYDVVSWNAQDVGAQQVVVHDDHIEFARLYIAPEWQGRGIGSAAGRRVLALADRLGLPIGIKVLRRNHRARAGYERAGFVVTRATDAHVFMVRASRGRG